MFEKLLLLISLLIFTQLVHAEPTFQTSGFLYNTTWQDNKFHSDRTVLAVNMSVEEGPLAFRTQLNTTENALRRATIEYSFVPIEDVETIAMLGRFGRVESFYNNILDAPSSSQMAVLPFAGYSYRMFNGSFVLMDGLGLVNKIKYSGEGLLTLKASVGRMVIDNQEDIQKEAFRTYNQDFEMKPSNGGYDLSAKLEKRYYTVYVARQVYKGHFEATNHTALNDFIANKYNKSEYVLDRVGLKVNYKDVFASTEYAEGDTEVLSSTGTHSSETRAADTNYVLGAYLGPYTFYIGESIGKNKSANYKNTDHFAGATYNYSSLATVSLARHIGNGLSWSKYDTAVLGEYRWNTWVVTTTIKF